MAVKRITRRWLFNSFGVILFILAAFVIFASYSIRSFYYTSVRQAVLSRANTVNALFLRYWEDSSTNYKTEVRNTIANFEERDKMELMAIDSGGNITLTSSGFEPKTGLVMPDYYDALNSPDGIGEAYSTMGGENILAISIKAPVGDDDFAVFRYVVSLNLIDQQVIIFIAIITLIGMAIIFFVVLSSSYFINSIVIPIGQVRDTALKIAQGDLGARLENHTHDEIGELCEVINNMADELQSSEKVKNEFISSVSHELRTPLTAIKGWAETLLADANAETADPETLHKGMAVIIRETSRLSSMVEELLDFSRLQNGRLSIQPERLDLCAELDDVVLMFTERARQEGIDLIADECEDIFIVNADKNRLRQVFVNIIDNAIKYSDSGDKIHISVRRERQMVTIAVADTGIGISSEDLPRVREKFFKANSTRRGSGIGLAVADELITMHGGSLTLESSEGVGTTVYITLPLARAAELQDAGSDSKSR